MNKDLKERLRLKAEKHKELLGSTEKQRMFDAGSYMIGAKECYEIMSTREVELVKALALAVYLWGDYAPSLTTRAGQHIFNCKQLIKNLSYEVES